VKLDPGDTTTTLQNNKSYSFLLPNWGLVKSAYITGFNLSQQYSVTEQIFVSQ
jgi:hypothetical protein